LHTCPYFPCSCQHFPAWNDKVVNFQAMKVLVATMMIPSEHLMSLLAKDLGWSNCEIDAGSYMGPLPWTFWEHDGKHIPTALSVTPHGTQHILLDWQGFALCYVLSQKAAVVATYTYSKTSMREGIFSWKPPCQCPFSIIWYSDLHCCLKSSLRVRNYSRQPAHTRTAVLTHSVAKDWRLKGFGPGKQNEEQIVHIHQPIDLHLVQHTHCWPSAVGAWI